MTTMAGVGPAMLDKTVAESSPRGMTLGLGATIAAPFPSMDTAAPAASTRTSLRTTNNSVLPRIDQRAEGARLVPSEGRRYETVKTLGRGGMGEVELVEDRDIGRSVALKRLLGEVHGPPAVARFVDEVRTIGRLEHPNIIPIHDVGVDDNGALFFVMKYVEGETLEAVLDRIKAGDAATLREYDVTRRVEIFVAILRALHFAHEKGVIHRDIKPANVMIGRYGEVVLMDWGVARPAGGNREGNAPDPSALVTSDGRASMTSVGALVGTPLYMSPEQARGQNDALDARSDLFSACVMFHEMLNDGHHRFEDVKTLPALLHGVQTTDPAGITRMFRAEAGVGPEYVHFLRRGLKIAPGDRWSSAHEMIEELHAILDGRCRVQCMATLSKRVTRGLGHAVDKSPRLAITLMMVAAVVVLGLVANGVHDVVARLM
jgi:serine/threonine-protein kinase